MPDNPVQTHFEEWALFGAPRDYDGDGIKDDMHEGLDLAVDEGDRVVAMADGAVIWASNKKRSDGKKSAYGYHVIVDHGNDYVTWYCHLKSMAVNVGQIVLQGEDVGLAGKSGNATGPHLHLNVQKLGAGLGGYVVADVIDPAEVLSA